MNIHPGFPQAMTPFDTRTPSFNEHPTTGLGILYFPEIKLLMEQKNWFLTKVQDVQSKEARVISAYLLIQTIVIGPLNLRWIER